MRLPTNTLTGFIVNLVMWFLFLDRGYRRELWEDPVGAVAVRILLVTAVVVVAMLAWMVAVPLLNDPLGAVEFLYQRDRTIFIK